MNREIVVEGHGVARALPDRATLRVVVEGEGSTREEAYNEAVELAGTVDRVVAARRGALGRVSTAAMIVNPKTRFHKGEPKRTGWRTTRTTILEVIDFTALGTLIAELAAAGSVAGPSWQLDPSNPVFQEARRLAAEDARRRGVDYADTLGLTIDGVAWVSEPGLRQGESAGNTSDDRARFLELRLASDGNDSVIEVAPDEIVVNAELEVSFRFTDPADTR